jgi:SAM-dependent methyltransferase
MTNENFPNLVCLCDKRSQLVLAEQGLVCADPSCLHSQLDQAFPVVDGVPVVVSEILTDTVCSVANTKSYVPRAPTRLRKLAHLLQSTSDLTSFNCGLFVQEVTQASQKPQILIVGAGTKGAGTSAIWENQDLSVVGIDIYVSPTVDVVCDAHYLPFPAESFDGVWIQAVLEHVVEPIKVVSELERVLKPGGLVYAETPFMQQVHEGAYDFTRYTVTGHRYLFRSFEAIRFGGNKGAEVAMAWSIKYLTWAVFRSRSFARMIGLLAGIFLRPLRFVTSEKSLFDSSSGVYFLGKKTPGHQLRHADLISLYRGNQ